MHRERRRATRAAAFHPGHASFSCARCALYISVVPYTRITAVLAYQKDGITMRGILILRRRENRNRKKEEESSARRTRARAYPAFFCANPPLR